MSVEKLFKESFQIDGFSGILQNMKNLNDKFFPLQIIIIIIIIYLFIFWLSFEQMSLLVLTQVSTNNG